MRPIPAEPRTKGFILLSNASVVYPTIIMFMVKISTIYLHNESLAQRLYIQNNQSL